MGEEVPPRCCCFQFDTLTIKKMKNFNLCFVHCPTHIPMFTWGVFKSHFSASNGLFRPEVGLRPQKTFMDNLSFIKNNFLFLFWAQKSALSSFFPPNSLPRGSYTFIYLFCHLPSSLFFYSFVSLWKALSTPCGSPYEMWSMHLQRSRKSSTAILIKTDTVLPHSGFNLESKCCICCKRTNWT